MPLKKLSKTKLSVLIFSFSILCLTLAFFLSGLTWKQIVDAFVIKGPHSTLTVNDWNGLMNDFVKKSGDTMTGSLTVPQIKTSKICLGGMCRATWPASLPHVGRNCYSFYVGFSGGWRKCRAGYYFAGIIVAADKSNHFYFLCCK